MNSFKKICKIIFVFMVLLVCVVPFVGMIFGWGESSTENRSLSAFPELHNATEDSTEINKNYTNEVTNYVTDNFGFRQEFVTADAFVKKSLFMHSTEPKVVIGNSGWYYFNETTADYTGGSALSNRGIYRLKTTLKLMNNYSQHSNITMVFLCAPNKNSIYPQHMPFNIIQSSRPSNLDRLSANMKDCNYYIDAKGLLNDIVENDKNRNYYFKHDSHWNNLGALAVFNEVEKNLNKRIEGFDYISYPFQEEYTETQVNGDLTDMLLPALKTTDTQYDLGIPVKYSSDQPLTNLMANDITTTCQGRYYDTICYRDSFSNALIGIMSNAFATTHYTRSLPYDLTAARNGRYNIAIVEIAERNLPIILNEAPILDAVAVNAPKKTHLVDGSQSCDITDNAEYVIINGNIGDWVKVEDISDIFIELKSDDNKSYYYQAFPISEGKPYEDNGFSIRISKYSLKNGSYKAYIHIGNSEETSFVKLDLE